MKVAWSIVALLLGLVTSACGVRAGDFADGDDSEGDTADDGGQGFDSGQGSDSGGEATEGDGTDEGSDEETTGDGGETTTSGDEVEQIGSCSGSEGTVSSVYWGPDVVGSRCTEGFFDGSYGGYAWGFDCPEGDLELTFDLDPDLPADFWPGAPEFEVRVRAEGEQVWFASFYPSGEPLALAVDAQSVTPRDYPGFFAPFDLALVSGGCEWDDTECVGRETAAVEVRAETIEPVLVFDQSHGDLDDEGRLKAWAGTIYIERDDTNPVEPEPCPPAELHDRVQLLIHGGQP